MCGKSQNELIAANIPFEQLLVDLGSTIEILVRGFGGRNLVWEGPWIEIGLNR